MRAGDRLAVLGRRLELELLHGLERGLVEAVADRRHDLGVLTVPVDADDQLELDARRAGPARARPGG